MASKIQYLSLVRKVAEKIKSHWGIDDKDTAEFIIEMAKEADTPEDYHQTLVELGLGSGAIDFSTHLYELVSNMLSANKGKVAGVVVGNGAASSSKSTVSTRAPTTEDEAQWAGLRVNDTRNREELSAGFSAREDVSEHAWNLLDQMKTPEERRRDEQKGKGKKGKGWKGEAVSRVGGMDRDRSPRRDAQSTRYKIESENRQEPITRFMIYACTVKKILESGAAILSFHSAIGMKEGICHQNELAREPGTSRPIEMSRGQQVYAKITTYVGESCHLSMREVEQATGEDLQPRDKNGRLMKNSAEEQAKRDARTQRRAKVSDEAAATKDRGEQTGVPLNIPDTLMGGKKDRAKHTMSDRDAWELQQIRNAGILTASELKAFDPNDGFSFEAEELEEEYEVETRDQEPNFLRNQTARSGVQLEPIRLIKCPEGSLAQMANNAEMAIQENRQARDAMVQEAHRNIPKDMNRPWEDPNPEPGTRALTESIRGMAAPKFELPEWKKPMRGGVSMGQKSNLPIKEQREGLPIFKLRNQLLKAVHDNQMLVVIGETGSGKTTQITQYLVEAGLTSRGVIGCTQPRRVAAISVAKRVAEEYGCRVGQEVGYCIRFEDCTSRDTIIKYMTDGMLMREILADGDLKKYSLIMLDEAHERTISTDILFALLKDCAKRRPDFKLIVTSATLDAMKFSSYFNDANIFTIPGRTFPVEISYALEPCEDNYVEQALTAIMEIHLREPEGDILLFLTGQEEIDTAAQILHERMEKLAEHHPPPLIILPVYSALPSEMQTMIFEPAPKGSRKVVIATNIAEASLTIDGIMYVVDPGMSKQKTYNAKTGMDSLVIVPISQASAKQRAGRAGRTGPGKCYRLYTEMAYRNEMSPMNVPEIQRSNLANVVLVLKAMGINDMLGFDFMDKPPVTTLINSLETLWQLGALDDEGLLTRLGRKMADFPMDPAQSKTLLVAVDLGCADEIVTIMGMLSVQQIFYRPRDRSQVADQKKAQFHQPEGDHITLLEVYKGWQNNRFSNPWCFENFVQARNLSRAREVRKQLIGILDKYSLEIKSCGNDYNRLRKTICAGYFDHACKRDAKEEGYKTYSDGQTVHIHPSSALYQKDAEYIVYHELVFTTKEYLREVCTIEPHWLPELAPNLFQKADANKISKRKQCETIEPLYNKHEAPGAWRLSRRMG